TMAGAQGIGFAMGGLALVFKRIQASFGLLQYVFMALIAVPQERFAQVYFFPLSLGSHLVREVMVGRASLLGTPPLLLAGLVANSAFYLALGYGVFKLCERAAQNRGLLGHY
ncbi:MAG TPA: hypothetical protein VE913_13365, partial [Longimicrobium sp.]|nr:hypothetical protein [Longimicrobium sp.]